jgi:hypothetical protein
VSEFIWPMSPFILKNMRCPNEKNESKDHNDLDNIYIFNFTIAYAVIFEKENPNEVDKANDLSLVLLYTRLSVDFEFLSIPRKMSHPIFSHQI